MNGVIQIVKFKSSLKKEEVLKKYEERAFRFREVPGLEQKYYVEYEDGRFGAVYIWADRESYDAYQATKLKGSIADAYAVIGEVSTEFATRLMDLR